ncbi:MAG: hypothetical protein ACPGXL_05165, partial [Chitinophagales bacterium]
MLRYLFAFTLVLLFGLTFFYFVMPTISYGFIGLPLGILMTTLLFILLMIRQPRKVNSSISKSIVWASVVVVACVAYLVLVPMASTWALFHAKDYHELIGEIKEGENFAKDIAPISTEKIRIVDQGVANRLGDKVLGVKPSLGSQVRLGRFNIQTVGDKLYWVAPLHHSGFFKWQQNKQGTTGYVKVSVTNERDVELVQEVNDRPIHIKYQPSAYFGGNLRRHIYFNGYITQGYTDYTFEIDDTGEPYWVVTLYDKKIGFSGNEAKGVILVHAETGDIQEYDIQSVPLWVDRVQPADFIVKQLDDWGEYVHGYWNFSNKDKLMTTKGISLVHGEDGKSYWYTGLTSVGSDEGTVGFVLVNTRDKSATWYRQIGATEYDARKSAMGKVQEKEYNASFPITYNINGIPTYVMSLKDDAGLIKMIAMVSVEDYSIVGVGNNLKESLRTYKNAYNTSGNDINPSSTVETFFSRDKIKRISTDISNGNTYYYM